MPESPLARIRAALQAGVCASEISYAEERQQMTDALAALDGAVLLTAAEAETITVQLRNRDADLSVDWPPTHAVRRAVAEALGLLARHGDDG